MFSNPGMTSDDMLWVCGRCVHPEPALASEHLLRPNRMKRCLPTIRVSGPILGLDLVGHDRRMDGALSSTLMNMVKLHEQLPGPNHQSKHKSRVNQRTASVTAVNTLQQQGLAHHHTEDLRLSKD